jgi:hypothetical protein
MSFSTTSAPASRNNSTNAAPETSSCSPRAQRSLTVMAMARNGTFIGAIIEKCGLCAKALILFAADTNPARRGEGLSIINYDGDRIIDN